MIFAVVFLSIITTLIAYKVRAIIKRNNLETKSEKRVLVISILLVLFIITNITLPYPQSLYWFIGLGLVICSIILSFDVIKIELRRFKSLSPKTKVTNVLYYSLAIVVTHILLYN